MNNELFDRMMKENLNKVHVSPTQGLKKSIGRKLFFQNILNFHKLKLVVATLLIGAAGVMSYSYLNADSSGVLSAQEYRASNETLERIEKLDDEVVQSFKKSIENNDESTLIAQTSKDNNDLLTNNVTGQEATVNSKEVNNLGAAALNTSATLVNRSNITYAKDESKKKSTNSKQTDVISENKVGNSFLEENNSVESKRKEQEVEFINFADPKGYDLSQDYLSQPVSVEEKAYTFNDKPIIRKELSIDVYKGLMATNDVDNNLKSSEHQEFYWDFYNENGGLKTSSLGGVDVNYAIGTKTLKGKVSLGFNASQVLEQKPTYEFNEITDPLWLEVFEVDELSWINTYGEDTCTQCFSTHNTEELQDELKKDNNVYKYISVPLKFGAEVNLKYVTLDLMGGMQWNHLTNASGIYITEKAVDNKELYYWDDMQVATLSKDNDMLKRNYFSWIASANLRVRLTRQFDLMAGYDMIFSNGNITHDTYIMNKSLKFSQAKIGITFYPNRLPLLKK